MFVFCIVLYWGISTEERRGDGGISGVKREATTCDCVIINVLVEAVI